MKKCPLLKAFIMINLLSGPSFADVISLNDGTVLNGKMVEDSADEIVFVNYYGNFRIKKTKIVKFTETKNAIEDINIQKKMGIKVDEELTERNYRAGEKKLEERSSGKDMYGEDKISARISMTITGIMTMGKINSVLPVGYGGTIDYDHNMEKIIGAGNNLFIPWLRIEGGAFLYKKNTAGIRGLYVSTGPLWFFPASRKSQGRFIFSFLTGISFLDIEKTSTDYKASSSTLILSPVIGYEFSFGSFSLGIHARYTYIYDKDVAMHNAGLGVCFTYSI
jgi:hypothetical protein